MKTIYRIVRFFVKLFFPRMKLEGEENLPEGACVAVSNHAQMNGPIAAQLYFPKPSKIWCAGEMMHWKEVQKYAFADFWEDKPNSVRWFYKILSYLIVPLSVCIFNSADCIAVYRDHRLLSTMRETGDCLEKGEKIVIMPEHNVPYNHIVYEFEDGFVNLARQYYRKTGKALEFVPMYVTPKLKKIVFGKPVVYDPDASPKEERVRIAKECMDAVTKLAEDEPEHTVIPYKNIGRKHYPTNRG